MTRKEIEDKLNGSKRKLDKVLAWTEVTMVERLIKKIPGRVTVEFITSSDGMIVKTRGTEEQNFDENEEGT